MKKILIIDDRDSVRMSFKLTLDDSGYQVQTAVNGREAIDIGVSCNCLPGLR